MQPLLSALAMRFEESVCPRSIERIRSGAGGVHVRPAAGTGSGDHALLFRTATRQLCRRMGFLATFMCRPALKGFYSSGWHLHQSLVNARTVAICSCRSGAGYLSPWAALSRRRETCRRLHFCDPHGQWLPTISAELACPDRATWCHDHRGVMIRVLGGPGSGHPDGEPDQSLPRTPTSISSRRSWPG